MGIVIILTVKGHLLVRVASRILCGSRINTCQKLQTLLRQKKPGNGVLVLQPKSGHNLRLPVLAFWHQFVVYEWLLFMRYMCRYFHGEVSLLYSQKRWASWRVKIWSSATMVAQMCAWHVGGMLYDSTSVLVSAPAFVVPQRTCDNRAGKMKTCKVNWWYFWLKQQSFVGSLNKLT